jgi:glycosyltransferase involved in cell wall biosynthesis
MKYALIRGYDIVVSIDADGQHNPEEVPYLVQTLIDEDADLVIGSRFARSRSYNTPFSRRAGQIVFSHLTQLLIGNRIYDTSSGFKAMTANACRALVSATFMDFHIETIVRLSMLGFKVIETPIVVKERSDGRSMHSIASIFQYPLKTLLLTIVAAMDVLIQRRAR